MTFLPIPLLACYVTDGLPIVFSLFTSLFYIHYSIFEISFSFLREAVRPLLPPLAGSLSLLLKRSALQVKRSSSHALRDTPKALALMGQRPIAYITSLSLSSMALSISALS